MERVLKNKAKQRNIANRKRDVQSTFLRCKNTTQKFSLQNQICSANVFFRLRYIEKFRIGIRRINYSYENSIIKPEYQVYENSITIILPLFDDEREVLSIEEKAIFDLLNRRSLTRAEIQTKCPMNKDKVIRILNNLIEKNSVRRIGMGRGTKHKKI